MASLVEYIAARAITIMAFMMVAVVIIYPFIERIFFRKYVSGEQAVKCTDNPFGENPCKCHPCTNKRERLKAIEEEILLMGRRAKALHDSKRRTTRI